MSSEQVKEKPILFSGAMVRAILSGAKTQTRRVVKGLPEGIRFASPLSESDDQYRFTDFEKHVDLRCPYGRPQLPLEPPRDRLWVRETWADADCMYQSHTNDVPGTIAYFADKSAIQYSSKVPRQVGAIDLASWNWNALKRRPSIFMPRWASRITLEITNVRVERLNEISEADAHAEGIAPIPCAPESLIFGTWKARFRFRDAFKQGWDSINGKRKGCTWADNPFVWCLSFKKL
jgi:hypothetical protein